MSCVAGHQPNLYPYGGFFAKAANVELFVIADNTQYVKKEYHNRNRIRVADGSVMWLSVPVKNAGHYKQKINEAEIDNSRNWRRQHGKTLSASYRRTPYFDLYFPYFDKLLQQEWKFLVEYNIAVIRLCMELLEIDTPVSIASELNVSGNSTGYILDICRTTESDTYLHGKHAVDYVDFKLLEDAGITNLIQTYNAVEYRQHGHDNFSSCLSVLDILFNCGPESKNIILAGHSSRPYSRC